MCKKDEIDIQLVETQVASLWDLLEKNMDIIDELSVMYACKIGEHENRQACLKEADAVAVLMQAIKKAESVIKDVMKDKSEQPSKSVNGALQNATPANPVSLQTLVTQHPVSEESTATVIELPHNHLQPLKVPTFEGCKTKFEDFWALYSSLVNQPNEPTNIKMAR